MAHGTARPPNGTVKARLADDPLDANERQGDQCVIGAYLQLLQIEELQNGQERP